MKSKVARAKTEVFIRSSSFLFFRQMYPWQFGTCVHVGLRRRRAGFGAGILCCRVGTMLYRLLFGTRIRAGKVLLADFRQFFKGQGFAFVHTVCGDGEGGKGAQRDD